MLEFLEILGYEDLLSLNSLPEQLLVIALMCSNMIISPASLAGSRSGGVLELLAGMKISLSLGMIFSVNALRPEGRSSTIVKTFFKIKDRRSRSFISSSKAGRTFFSNTDLGNEGSTLDRPRMNCAFSLGVLAGRESKNRMVDIKILSKYALCWNSFAVIRCAGRRVISRGSTDDVRSLGIGLEDKKPLVAEGIDEEDAKSLLYAEILAFVCNGEVCGELYKAIINNPRENMSAAMLRFESKTKSGEV